MASTSSIPTATQLKESQLELVVAGTREGVLMVESEADSLPEDVMLGAVMFGHQQMQTAIQAINELKAEAGKPAWNWQPAAANAQLEAALAVERRSRAVGRLQDHRQAGAPRPHRRRSRKPRVLALARRRRAAVRSPMMCRRNSPTSNTASCVGSILAGEPRIDGRDTKTVRPISIRTGVLPRTHGSALFTRGETQALVVTTLGTGRDAQIIDALAGERKEPFMLHYNFPPFSVGETGMMGSPKRREIGHGNLARRGISAVMPDMATFPYVIRVVSEILESNGSSSMASVCGTSLALMDAGVPIKGAVAGVAMGLVKEGDRFQVLTDILGDEDHLGDMDFKVAGTRSGVTALQMDIKIDSITQRDHAGRARPGEGRPPAHPRRDGQGARRSRARRCRSGRPRSSRSRSTRRRSAKSSARAARSSARSPKRPARRSTSRTTAR